MRRKRYNNLGNIQNKKTWDHFIRWQRARRTELKDYSYVIPSSRKIDLKFLQSNRSETSITWIGHSTFLIQVNGLNIVTDPVWAMRMGLHNRLTMPGIPIAAIPEIDVVLISHSHYDHLHFRSIRSLKGNPEYLVPEGLAYKFMDKGFYKVREFSWWQEWEYGPVTFSFVPAQHWSKRTPWDTNTSHWGGWVITAENGESTYFVGDSGYFDGFKKIGSRFNLNHVLMPIGAYEPEWFMSLQHVSPEEAVRAFMDVRGRNFIPMHFSTFRLADDTPWEAIVRLEAEWVRQGIEKERLRILKLGETFRPRLTQ
ncbi:MAG TPA: MBL fold metallo-hydrolase [Bacillota bacterium]|nr:MBL fold metallo-hydrolase [Bacillota bacterium]